MGAEIIVYIFFYLVIALIVAFITKIFDKSGNGQDDDLYFRIGIAWPFTLIFLIVFVLPLTIYNLLKKHIHDKVSTEAKKTERNLNQGN